MKTEIQSENVRLASAQAKDVPISTKHSVEISRNLRYHSTSYAKQFLEGVASLQRAVPFKRFTKDRGHKAGMATGQFPQKAAKQFLKLLHAVEANAQIKGMDAGNLKIVKILANKAPIPFTGSRLRRKTKRTHIELVVQEMGREKKVKSASSTRSMAGEIKQVEKAGSNETLKKVETLKEVSSENLLNQAQARAAELHRKEKEKKDTEEVTQLAEELQKKGTLRGKQAAPRGAKK